ncbi:TPA: fimbrial protein [Klebsiella oxytoca]|nr:fimbrial protein [Klebsiella oxytoca]
MKLSMSTGHKYNVRLKMAAGLLALTVSLFSAQAQALKCGFGKIFTETVSIPVIGPGIATAGEDAPVGQILYRQSFNASSRVTNFSCTVEESDESGAPYAMNVYTITEVASTPSGPPLRTGTDDIFPTNIPGIGAVIRIFNSGNYTSFPGTWENTSSIQYGTTTLAMSQITRGEIRFIKTGPIASGVQQIQAAALPTFRVISGSNSPFVLSHVFINLNFTGTTTVHTKTCQLPTSDIQINLGSHEVSAFDSPGKATEWKDFDIVLKDCPPFYGYGNYTLNESSGRLTGSSTDNVASIVFRSASGIVDGNASLAKLDDGVGVATGVGIELSRRDISGSIAMDGSGGFNLPDLPKEDNATYTIPLKARYVQTDSTVKPGPANGSVIFTITYL